MKSSSHRTSTRGARLLIKYSELGIPVFFIGFGISDSLRLLAPDVINWIEPLDHGYGEQNCTVEPHASKHTGSAAMDDLGQVPGPA